MSEESAKIRTKAEVVREFRRNGLGETHPDIKRVMVAQVRALLTGGLKDHDVVDKLAITWEEFKAYRRDMYASEMMLISQRDPAEIFIDYRLSMEGICDDLKDIEKGAKKAKQFAAAMGAAKARAQIIDNTINRGQEMGVIPRAAKKHEHVGGLLVATLTDVELLDQLRQLSSRTDKLLKTYGDEHFLTLPEPDIYAASAAEASSKE